MAYIHIFIHITGYFLDIIHLFLDYSRGVNIFFLYWLFSLEEAMCCEPWQAGLGWERMKHNTGIWVTAGQDGPTSPSSTYNLQPTQIPEPVAAGPIMLGSWDRRDWANEWRLEIQEGSDLILRSGLLAPAAQ